jgi:gluconate 2-dehydrogenase gamma chain
MKTNRRQILKVLGAAPMAAAAQKSAAPPAAPSYKPKALTAQEFRTARVLADLILPADERSGSASQAGVPEYIDEVLADRKGGNLATQIKGGLAWLDREANRRFGADFARSKAAQQREILDLVAYPKKAAPEYSHAVAFFNRFRDLTSSGFYSSKIGIADLGYLGNTAVDHWDGCPPEALKKLGI